MVQDPALWPRNRSLKMLKEWCSFEHHTVVVDTGASPLADDEFEERMSHAGQYATCGYSFRLHTSASSIDCVTSGRTKTKTALPTTSVSAMALTSAGRFEDDDTGESFIIEESYMESRPVGGRFERDGLSMTFRSQHRPIGAYTKALESAGFTISAMRELTPDDDHLDDVPKVAKRRRIPLYLHVRSVRLPS